jgi:hypothetical protein
VSVVLISAYNVETMHAKAMQMYCVTILAANVGAHGRHPVGHRTECGQQGVTTCSRRSPTGLLAGRERLLPRVR